ncbi:hypothetical protein TSUD_172460 [Trifolium subterraneum]|uniref:F-box protein At3g26010-like beta-propeller domain-containing protein n=1 Tax=Trifolium subterraneum TaxID=3900 RepID=A0A2Z6LXX1_TRISU|nr:hypothetical protein TSUD_172460 [Trifolium subterraneum]
MRRRIPRSFFKNIPSELESKILGRLCMKDKSSVMCVSHSWRERILTLPREEAHQSSVRLIHYPIDNMLQELFHWCSQIMHCMVGPKELIDACNGLLLFCHNNGRANNVTHGVYHYYVLNHITKQCVAIPKPVGQNSGGYSYATLVYDPDECWFFKILRFQGRRHINIFSSENGVWTTLTLNLPEHVIASSWMQKSVYLNGSVYRLCRSGHLIKIRVDPQENVSEQAEPISLTPDCLLDNCHWDITVKNGKLLFVTSTGVNFMVYELVESVTRDVTTYSWCNIYRTQAAISLLHLNNNSKLLSFHPYNEVAFFKRYKNLLYYFKVGNNNIIDIKEVPYNDIHYDYLRYGRPPLFECFKPFICCLNKENSGVFQRLPVPL